MNREVGRVTPCAPIGLTATAARRGLTRPATAGSWSRFASDLWKFPLPIKRTAPLGGYLFSVVR